MLFGYAYISVDDPELTEQRRMLKEANCQEIFEDRGSGGARARFGLTRLFDTCREGDVLLVQRLERLGRSPAQVIEILHNLLTRGIGLRSLSEEIDTTAPSAAQAPALIGALAMFQKDR